MKKKLRKHFKKLRASNENMDDYFIDFLYTLVNKFSNIALYMKIGHEVNLEKLINKLFLIKNIYLPVVKGKELEFRKFSGFSSLSFDDANIKAPVNGELIDKNSLDVIVTSCLAANFQGYRLGYGGGYYDRYLKDFHGLNCCL